MSEPIYRWMLYRLYSFLHYPESAFFRPPQLANLGFYSRGRGEEVTCYGCGVSHTNFQPGQNIRRTHIQRSPDCPLNVSGDVLRADDASAARNVVPQDLPNLLPNGDRPLDDQSVGYFSWELQTKIVFRRSEPNFKLLVAEGIRLRRHTFVDWPGRYREREQLALLGFFYTGTLDTVQCCMCGIMYRARLMQELPGLRQTLCPDSCRLYF